jgi:hypothetical protein
VTAALSTRKVDVSTMAQLRVDPDAVAGTSRDKAARSAEREAIAGRPEDTR